MLKLLRKPEPAPLPKIDEAARDAHEPPATFAYDYSQWAYWCAMQAWLYA